MCSSDLVIIDYLVEIYVDEFGFGLLFLYVASSIVYVGFAVSCHRLVLLGSTAVPKLGILRWSGREIRFFVWGLKIGIVFIIAVSLVATITAFVSIFLSSEISLQPILIILMLPVVYYLSRVMPIFPATAVGEDYDLKWAYNLTKGNGFRMVIIIALIPLVMAALSYIVDYLFGENSVSGIIFLMFGYVVTIIEIAAVSISYDFLCKSEELS